MSNGMIRHVAENAATEADELEREAADLERRASDSRRRAYVLRALHAIAAPHAEPNLALVKGDPAA